MPWTVPATAPADMHAIVQSACSSYLNTFELNPFLAKDCLGQVPVLVSGGLEWGRVAAWVIMLGNALQCMKLTTLT
jgi:hypothetical protein